MASHEIFFVFYQRTDRVSFQSNRPVNLMRLTNFWFFLFHFQLQKRKDTTTEKSHWFVVATFITSCHFLGNSSKGYHNNIDFFILKCETWWHESVSRWQLSLNKAEIPGKIVLFSIESGDHPVKLDISCCKWSQTFHFKLPQEKNIRSKVYSTHWGICNPDFSGWIKQRKSVKI